MEKLSCEAPPVKWYAEELTPLLEQAAQREREHPPALRIRRSSTTGYRSSKSDRQFSNREDLVSADLIVRKTGCHVDNKGMEHEWYQVLHRFTAGRAHINRDTIYLTVGWDSDDRHLVLLHELAHIIEWRRRRNRKHDKRFWRTAARLYRKAGISIDAAREREAKVYRRAALYL